MKHFLALLVLSLAVPAASARTWTHINPVLGDQSFLLKYGTLPNDCTPDQLRIAAHLEYAEFVLRSKDVNGMSPEQIAKRTHLLDLLHDYWTRGIFPKNEDETDERRPCFIDREGTICAVGYLVEQTAGRDIAELINERFMYNEILEMNDPLVLNWIEACGLTREECAMIQPGYGSPYVTEPQLAYGLSYRIDDNFYHSVSLYSVTYTGGGMWGAGKKQHLVSSAGIKFDFLSNKNFSFGFRYARALGKKRRKWGNLAFMPECFRYSKTWGMNLKPEFELIRTFKYLELGLGYSYAVPIIS